MEEHRMSVMRLAALTTSLALVLLACGGTTPTSAPTASDGGSSPSEDPGASDEAISGTVSLWYLEDPEFTFLPALKAEFEAAYPGVTVEMTEIPEDGYVTKVDTAILAGQPPDLGFIYEARWMKAGSILPLDDIIGSAGIDTSTLNQAAFSECQLDGQVYCLGSLGGSVMLIYNKDLFDAAGVAYPSATEPMTIDEYAALARQLAQPSDDPATNVFGGTADVPFWWTQRNTTFSEDGKSIAGFVNDEPTIHMYDVLATMARDGTAPTAAQAEAMSSADMLGGGVVAMAITDMEVGASSLETAGANWGAAPVPVETDGNPGWVFTGTDKYGVFTQGPNQAAAKALIAFLGKEGSRIRVEASDDPPLDSTWLDDWAGDNASRQEVASVMNLTAPIPLIPGFWDVTAPLGDGFSLMVAEEVTAADFLNEEAPNMQDNLDQAWETWDAIQ
jgi:multiple sugar transport system substrate-binding protein